MFISEGPLNSKHAPVFVIELTAFSSRRTPLNLKIREHQSSSDWSKLLKDMTSCEKKQLTCAQQWLFNLSSHRHKMKENPVRSLSSAKTNRTSHWPTAWRNAINKGRGVSHRKSHITGFNYFWAQCEKWLTVLKEKKIRLILSTRPSSACFREVMHHKTSSSIILSGVRMPR